MQKGDDPYELLGVPRDAAEADIKKAYRKLALKHHPDRQKTDEEREKAHDLFAKLSAAYETLTDPVKKYDYDLANNKEKRPSSSGQKSSSTQKKKPPPPDFKNFQRNYGGGASSGTRTSTTSGTRPSQSAPKPKQTPKPKPAPRASQFSPKPSNKKKATFSSSASVGPGYKVNETPKSPQPKRGARSKSPRPGQRRTAAATARESFASPQYQRKSAASLFGRGRSKDDSDTSYSYVAPEAPKSFAARGRPKSFVADESPKPKSMFFKRQSAAPSSDTSYSYVAPDKKDKKKSDTSYSYVAPEKKPDSSYSFVSPKSSKRKSTPYAGKPKDHITKLDLDGPSSPKKDSSYSYVAPDKKKPDTSYSYAAPKKPVSTKRVSTPYAGRPKENVTRVDGSVQPHYHDPYEIFNSVMKDEFGDDYKNSKKSGWRDDKSVASTKNGGKKKKRGGASSAQSVTPEDPDAPVSVSTQTKTIEHDDGRVEVKTITKIIRQDGSVEKVVQSSIAEDGKDVSKLPSSNTKKTYKRPDQKKGLVGRMFGSKK